MKELAEAVQVTSAALYYHFKGVAIVFILVSANLAAEWIQGTLRNLLILAGKMLAVVLFVLFSMLLYPF